MKALEKTRVCTTCKKEKSLDKFYKKIGCKLNKSLVCKHCENIYRNAYVRTELGAITQMYALQRQRSKDRGHNMPTYTKEEFTTWLYKNGYKTLYDNWVDSDYDKMVKPSADRLDDDLGYSFDNIRLVTWQENCNKGRKKGMKYKKRRK